MRRRRATQLASVGTACVVGALVHGMVDIYWIAGSVTLPFLLLGMGLGADDDPDEAPAGHGRHVASRRSANRVVPADLTRA